MKSQNQTTSQTHMYDENFLQDWLENRYGCGFAQMVLDDLEKQATHIRMPYEASSFTSSNDNHDVTLRHSA